MSSEIFGTEDNETTKKISQEIRPGLAKLHIDEWGDKESDTPELRYKDIFGLCFDCRHLRFVETRWGKIHARCYEVEIVLNHDDPVDKCSYYEKKTILTLGQMVDIATIIDLDKKDIIGFGGGGR